MQFGAGLLQVPLQQVGGLVLYRALQRVGALLGVPGGLLLLAWSQATGHLQMKPRPDQLVDGLTELLGIVTNGSLDGAENLECVF